MVELSKKTPLKSAPKSRRKPTNLFDAERRARLDERFYAFACAYPDSSRVIAKLIVYTYNSFIWFTIRRYYTNVHIVCILYYFREHNNQPLQAAPRFLDVIAFDNDVQGFPEKRENSKKLSH